MELHVVIGAGLVVGFLSIIGWRITARWFRLEEKRLAVEANEIKSQEVERLQNDLKTAEYAAANWKARYKREYDLDFEEVADPDAPESEQLSSIVESIFPQLPKSFTRLVDKPEIQEMIAKKIADNPDKAWNMLEGFIKKKLPSDNRQSQIDNMVQGV